MKFYQMRCSACDYTYLNENYDNSNVKFISIEGSFKKLGSELSVKLCACPKCGTVKIESLF